MEKNESAKYTNLPSASTRWYKILSDISPIGIFFTDADGNCIHVNKRWCEIAGLTPEEAMNTGWVKAIHEEDRERVSKEWYAAARNRTPFHLEYRFQSKDKVTWLIGDARAIYDEDGKIWGYIGTTTDFDRSYRKFQKASETADRIRSIVNHLPLVFFAIGHQNRIKAWNHEAERVTGYSFKELINSKGVIDHIFLSSEFKQEIFTADEDRDHFQFNRELQLKSKSGAIRTVVFTDISKYHPIPEWKLWCVGIDVTDRLSAERKLNERIKELNCLYKISILNGRPSSDINQFLQEAVDTIPPAWQYPDQTVARIVYGNNIFKTDHFKLTPWKLSSAIFVNGEITGLIEVFYTAEMPAEDDGPFLNEERLLLDEIAVQVSHKVESIQAAKNLQIIDELSVKTKELEHFSHTVTHDLKIPLTGISGYAQFLKEAYEEGKTDLVKSCIDNIENICNDMSRRLDEILQLAKAGQIIRPDEIVDLNAVIAAVIDMMEKTLLKEKITIMVDDSFPPVIGDGSRLAEVFENLLDNAVKYIGTSKKKIYIGWEQSDDELIVYVKDTGIGIAPKDFDVVFQLFKKLDKTATGDGTGLAICKRIVEAHRGRIWVESEGLNKGARFCFALPRNEDEKYGVTST